MQQYLNYLQHILDKGVYKDDRTGVGTVSVFGYQMRFDLSQGFPLLTTKKLHIRSVVYELLWFLKGHTNIEYLNENGVSIWDEWADERGELGPIYGKQWRRWRGNDNIVDQIENLIAGLRRDPHSRRHIVNAWNVGDLHRMALPPCHMMFQCYVANNKLSLQWYQRSVDSFLGLPFNIASYAFLTHIIAQQVGLGVGELIFSGGDCHIYSNHIEQVNIQLGRTPRHQPAIRINRKPVSVDEYSYEDFEIIGYDPWPHISAPVAI